MGGDWVCMGREFDFGHAEFQVPRGIKQAFERYPMEKGSCNTGSHVGSLVTDPARGPAIKTTL